VRPLIAAACALLVVAACGRSGLAPARRTPTPVPAQASCPSPFVACDQTCIDPSSSRQHCGARDDCRGPNAGAACAGGQRCDRGACVLTCQAALIACEGACVDPSSSPRHCGARGDCLGANAGAACADGTTCTGGSCAPPCGPPNQLCGDACVLVATDPAHCGGCALACAAGEACVGGVCREARRCSDPLIADYGVAPPGLGSAIAYGIGGDGTPVGDGGVFFAWISLGTAPIHARRFVPDSLVLPDASLVSANAYSFMLTPHLAVGGGHAMALWGADPGMPDQQTASRFDPVAATWSAPQPIGVPLGAAVDGYGNEIILVADTANPGATLLRRFDAAAGRFTDPVATSLVGVPEGTFAVGAGGNLLALTRTTAGDDAVMRVVSFNAGGVPTGVETELGLVPRPGGAWATALGPTGMIVVVAAQDAPGDGGPGPYYVRARASDSTTWAGAFDLQVDSFPQIAAGPQPRALAAWTRPDSAGSSLWSIAWPSQSAIRATQLAASVVATSNLAMNRAGDAAITELSASGGLWLHRFDGATGDWIAPQLVASDTPQERGLHYFIALTLDSDGRAAVFWRPGSESWGDVRLAWCD
jgi:hypothetical protein